MAQDNHHVPGAGDGAAIGAPPGSEVEERLPPAILGFLAAPTGLLVEDFSQVLPQLGALHMAHGDALPAWLQTNPAEVDGILHGIRLEAANGVALRLFGVESQDELWTSRCRNPSEGLRAAWVPLLAAVAAEATSWTGATAAVRGPERHLTCTCAVTPDARVITAIADATEREQIERELRRTSAFLDAIVENIPDMVFVKEAKDLRFVRFNRAGEALLGIPRAAMYGRNDFDFFPPAEAEFFTSKDRSVLESGEVLVIPEEPIHTVGSGVRWLHTKKVPLRGEDGMPSYLLGISEDITALRDARQSLERRTKELERSNRDLEQFAYVASHDLHEPLRTIASFVQLLLTDVEGSLSESGRSYANFVLGGVARMRELIDGLLELSRVGASQGQRAPVDLAEVLRDVQESLRGAIYQAGARLEADSLPTVEGDPNLLRQLLQNLVSNAVKFRRPEHPPVVRVSVRLVGDSWQVDVADNGVGFHQRYAEQIFGIFKRLHHVGAYPGCGIGLAVCRRIVEEHGGRIWARSTPGEGATFSFTLPRETQR